MHKLFEVYISRPDDASAGTGASIALPATAFEIQDVLERARITEKHPEYLTDVLYCKPDNLAKMIPLSADVYELNHLAQRLQELDGRGLCCFEGMVKMAAAQTRNNPVPLEQLINFTYTTQSCHFIPGAQSDEDIGRFYVDNDFPVIPLNLPEAVYEVLDYESIGRRARTSENGVFTADGYVVQSGGIAQTYKKGVAVPPEKPLVQSATHTVTLKVQNGFFNNSDDDKKQAVILKLPCNNSELDRAMEAVGAASERECCFTAVDCRVPYLVKHLNDVLDEGGTDGYYNACELAEQLRRLEQNGGLITYKAMLEAAPKNLTLPQAIDLSYQTEGFFVIREAFSPADYAMAELSKCSVPLPRELFSNANLYQYGEKLMERDLAVETEYGILITLDGQTVERCLGGPACSQGMDIG